MNNPSTGTGMRTFSVIILAIFALILLIGGIWLAVLGGSIYYIIAGLLLLATAVLLKKSDSKAFWVYAALMLGTVIWGVWEAGTDFWALAPRLDILGY